MRLELQAPLVEARVRTNLVDGGWLLVLLLDGKPGLPVSVAVECKTQAQAEQRGGLLKPGQAVAVQCDGLHALVSGGKDVLRPAGRVKVSQPGKFLFG